MHEQANHTPRHPADVAEETALVRAELHAFIRKEIREILSPSKDSYVSEPYRIAMGHGKGKPQWSRKDILMEYLKTIELIDENQLPFGWLPGIIHQLLMLMYLEVI